MPVDLQRTTDYFNGILTDLEYIQTLSDFKRRKNLQLMVEGKIKDLFLGTAPEENEVILNLFSKLDKQKQQEIMSVIEKLKGEEIKNLLAELESRKKVEIDDIIEKMAEDEIVKYWPYESCGYRGKDITIKLPKKGAFEGFDKRYFVSDDAVYNEDYENEEEVRELSISDVDVVSLLNAFRSYIKEAYGLQIDPDIDYFEELSKGRYNRELAVAKVLKELGAEELFKTRSTYFIKSERSDNNCLGFGDGNMFFGRFQTGMGMGYLFLRNNK